MKHDMQFYKANKHSISNQVNHVHLGGLHNPSSLLKKENLSLLRDLVNTSIIYFSVLMKFKIVFFSYFISQEMMPDFNMLFPKMLN